MKNQPKLLAVLTSAALVAGCASGGGHGGGDDTRIDTPEEAIVCLLLGPFCLFFMSAAAPADEPVSSQPSSDGGAPARAVAPSGPKVALTSWSELPRGAQTEAESASATLRYAGKTPVRATFAAGSWESTEVVEHDAQGNLVIYDLGRDSYGGRLFPSSDATAAPLAALGQPGIDVRQQASPYAWPQTGVSANPYVLGWEYQSFGVWNTQEYDGGSIYATTFGAPTPASAVPTSGSATFSGKVAGFYISPQGQSAMAAGELSVNANFNTRSLTLSSSGTALTPDAKTATAAPHLNLKGTLTYAPNTNSFSGTLVNSSGTMSGASQGKFYGPAAQELGGVFTVKSATTVETFTGAYGAKR